MSFVRILVDSFILLKKCPRFFIPKILVAFFFLPIIILLPTYIVHFNIFSPEALAERGNLELVGIMFQLLFLIIFTMVVYFIDSFLVNPMHPMLVSQYYKKRKINFRKAFIAVVRRFGTIFASLFIFSILLFASMLPFMFVMAAALLLHSDFLLYVSIIVAVISIFIMLILFYLIYPISSLERVNFVKAITETINTSLKHKKNVTEAVIVSLFISTLSYLLAFEMVLTSPEQTLLLLFFFSLLIATRFLIAIFTTYQCVLNAVFYLGLEKGVFLGK